MNNFPQWNDIRNGMPTVEEFGPYPTVDVILQCDQDEGRDPWQRRVSHAVLRFIGGNKDKPFWVQEKSNGVMLENDAWYVTHWRRIEDYPQPWSKP